MKVKSFLIGYAEDNKKKIASLNINMANNELKGYKVISAEIKKGVLFVLIEK